MQQAFTIAPKRVGIILALIAIILAIQSLFTEYLVEVILKDIDSDNVLVLVLDLFSVNLEESIPTWYSTIILFIASGLLWVIAFSKRHTQDRYTLYWFGLATIFLYLSMDEGAVIHEILADPLQKTFNTQGFLAFGWQIVAIPLVIIFVLLYIRFLLGLPARFRLLFIIAGSVYISGALIVEGISADRWATHGTDMTYLAIATIEESCEMLGVVLFIYALLAYMLEMDYVFIWTRQKIDLKSVSAVSSSSHSLLSNKNWATVLVILLIFNIGFLGWVSQQQNEQTETDSQMLEEEIIDALDIENVFVMQVTGVFSFENQATQQAIISLLPFYDQIIVLSLISTQSSLIFASDALQFDQQTLTQVLHDLGETQFIILDTPLLEVIAANS